MFSANVLDTMAEVRIGGGGDWEEKWGERGIILSDCLFSQRASLQLSDAIKVRRLTALI